MAEFRADFGSSAPTEGLRARPASGSDPSEYGRKQKDESLAALRVGTIAARQLISAALGTGEVWETYALCKTLPPSTFFPSDGRGVEVARQACAPCPVREECLEHALVNRIDHGIWGGTSERERRRILKRRRAG